MAGFHAPGGAGMITSLKTSPDPWRWPLACTTYDRTSTLSADESHALADRVQRSDAGQYCSSVDMPAVLHRLTRPLHDVLISRGQFHRSVGRLSISSCAKCIFDRSPSGDGPTMIGSISLT